MIICLFEIYCLFDNCLILIILYVFDTNYFELFDLVICN